MVRVGVQTEEDSILETPLELQGVRTKEGLTVGKFYDQLGHVQIPEFEPIILGDKRRNSDNFVRVVPLLTDAGEVAVHEELEDQEDPEREDLEERDQLVVARKSVSKSKSVGTIAMEANNGRTTRNKNKGILQIGAISLSTRKKGGKAKSISSQ